MRATTGLTVRSEEAGDDARMESAPLGTPAPRGGAGLCGLPGVPRPRAGPDPRGDPEAPRQGPGYLKPIERWSALRDWRGRAGAWDAHLQAERDRVAREEAEKWERRRLQALEDGWRPAGRCGPGWRRCSPCPRRCRRPSPRPSLPGRRRGPPRRRSRRPRRPGDGGTRADAGELNWRWRGCRGWSSNWSGRC